METLEVNQLTKTPTKKTLTAGWIISGICILFLVFDAVMKIIKEIHSIQGSVQLGWPEPLIQPIGIVLLICTILYAVPRTAFIGALSLTAYLGGAVAIMVRAGQPLYFAVVFGVLVWIGLYLRDAKIQTLIR
jgi:hypothetical protein